LSESDLAQLPSGRLMGGMGAVGLLSNLVAFQSDWSVVVRLEV
jgi:hypothetical protein